MSNPSGGNIDAIREALGRASEASQREALGEGALPLATEVADRVSNTICQNSREQVMATIRDKGMMVGGVAVALDGIRRGVLKDGEGKTHKVRAAVQTTIGLGMFTAGVISDRHTQKDQSMQR